MSTTGTRVLIVDHTAQLGGGEMALLRLAAASRLDIEVWLMETGPLSEALAGQNIPTTARSRSLLSALRDLRTRLRSAHRERIPVVANSLRSAALVALLQPRGAQWGIFVRDGVDPASLPGVRRLLFRLSAWRSTFLLANSEWTKRTIEAASRRPCSVVYTVSGIDAVRPDLRPLRGEDDPLELLFIGRLVEWKGPHLAIAAAAEAATRGASLRLKICGSAIFGDDAYVERLRAIANAAPLDVEFTGQVAISEYLDRADLLLHTSTRPEPFGQIVVQALAAGRAVAAPDAGGPAEILAGCSEALLYPLGDERALADLIVSAWKNPAALRERATATARAALPFIDACTVGRFDAAIERLREPR